MKTVSLKIDSSIFRETEKILENKQLTGEQIERALATFSQEMSPIDDIRSTRRYRNKVSLNLLEDFLRSHL